MAHLHRCKTSYLLVIVTYKMLPVWFHSLGHTTYVFFIVHISTWSQFPQMHHSLDASHLFPQCYNIAKMLSEEDLRSGGNKAFLKLERENRSLQDRLDDLQCIFYSFITHISSSTIIHRTKLIATLNVESRHTPLTPGSIHSGIH